MRVPYSWLRDVVAAGAPGWDVAPEDLEQALVRIGHEVEEVIALGPVDGPLTVGRVTEIDELTEFKKPIRACKVDVGEHQPREIICGATNFAVSDLVVVALPGTTLPGGFSITARKTYGRSSDGMICSAAELGLAADHSGILVLPPGTAEPGASGAEVLGLDDVIFDLAITPDRGYCMSVRGLAREIACARVALQGGGLAADGAARDRCAAIRTAPGERDRPGSGVAVVAAAPAVALRDPGDFTGCRCDELRDAGTGSPDACARPQADHRGLHGAVRPARRDGGHP
jgi:tRNA-binding EMAP/Myf-like protein